MLKPTSRLCSTLVCCLLSCSCVLGVPLEGNQGVSDQTLSNKRPSSPNYVNNSLKTHKYFLRQIFVKYGRDGVLTFEEFEHLLISLGIGNMIPKNSDLSAPHQKNHNHGTSEDGLTESQANRTVAIYDGSESSHHHDHNHHEHSSSTNNGDVRDQSAHLESSRTTGEEARQTVDRTKNQNEGVIMKQQRSSGKSQNKSLVNFRSDRCLTPSDILSTANVDPFRQNISEKTFLMLCPVILYELDRKDCHSSYPIYHHQHQHLEGGDIVKEQISSGERPSKYMWFYGTVAVLVISLTGLLSVAIVPIIQRYFYKRLLHFLVALAVGSLLGDALLHLLPHAMKSVGGGEHKSHGDNADHSGVAEHSHADDHQHSEIWIGLVALGGVCLFFCAEKFLNMIVAACKTRKEAKAVKTNIELSTVVGEKLSKHRYRESYGYTYEGVTAEVLQGLNTEENNDKHSQICYDKPSDNDVHNVSSISEKKLLPPSDLHKAYIYPAPNSPKEKELYQESMDEHGKAVKELGNGYSDKSAAPVMLSDGKVHSHSHGHGHGHGHSHSHGHGGWKEVPQTAIATAWMVIAGDGLHNFCDGMAIGAAFASGLTGGLSTAIAVFCHELPHELGDFALLLKAGIAIKQALLYNGLSALLCFLGMCVGLAIGNIPSVNAYIFAGVAGMFIYIALVDMLPELNSENDDSKLFNFGLQALGIACGVTIMCLIAVYEHDLQNIIRTGS